MTNNYTPISSTTSAAAQVYSQPQGTASAATSDLVASFKEIFSTMMMTNSASATDQTSGLGAADLMAPLMLMLLEKLVEQQLDTSALTGTVTTGLNLQPEPSGRPVLGMLTQNFHPGHNGLDFGVVVGTPIESTMDGKVVYAGWNEQGYGNLVIVENGAYRTYYAHLSNIPVAVGDAVAAGDTIGLSGNTGNSTGPHLHYEIRKNNVPIDPTAVTLGASA